MKNTIRISLVLVLLFSSVIVLSPVQAVTEVTSAIDWIGDIDGAAFHIRVPEDWNGTLLVYAHGYTITVPDPPDAALGGEFSKSIYWTMATHWLVLHSRMQDGR